MADKLKPWGKQKLLLQKDIPSLIEINSLIAAIPNPRTRALVILEYLTGGRVSELVGRKEHYLYSKEAIEGAKAIAQIKNKEGGVILKYKILQEEIGIKKNNLLITEMQGRKVLLIKMYNRKNKTKKRKEIPIPIDKEEAMIAYLVDYLNTLAPEGRLFPFGRIRAYQLVMAATGINNHFYRHIRASHLVMYHDYNEYKLIRFMGWSDGRPAKSYMALRTQDLLY